MDRWHRKPGPRTRLVIAACLALTVAPACSGDTAADLVPAADGIGDPYYPSDGNRGYDVLGYDVTTTYDPAASSFTSTTRVTAEATATRATFDLDLDPSVAVTLVVVGSRPATFTRAEPHELVIRPAVPLVPGMVLDIVVSHHGVVGDSGPVSGWHSLRGGGGVMAGEPHSCAYWYPCNDHPTDKATFRLTATVPERFTVVSNGLEGPTSSAGSGASAMTTYRWHLDTPTATYLTTILVDELTVRRSTLTDGTPVVDAYSTGATHQMANESRLPAILDLLREKFGPYPAPAAGGMFIDAQVGFSLETFTRPVYTDHVGISTIVHENAHQWWGDNVSVRRWKDVCLNECMASYAEWLWREHGGADLDAYYRRTVERLDLTAAIYDMGPGQEFTYEGVYVKGAYFEHALRRLIGDDATYFAALQGIQRDFAGANLGMLDLRNELSRRTGVVLTGFWQEWVLETGRPSPQNLFPGTLGG